MLKILLKKQLSEVFRSYFYDAKKNRMRPKWAVALWFLFFVVIMVALLGGIFTFLSLTLCNDLVQAGIGWLYFVLMGGISILLGAFGSVFNTYAGLYLSRDNDLLLSMPIPVRTIITARLANVWLMGTMYSATVLLPALIVYWVVAGVTAARVICGIALFLIVTVVVLLLSCLLGWVVAKISLKLKYKSFVSVIVSLVFVGGYYFFYFKANDLIRDILQNAVIYGEKIKGAAYGLYLFGRIGEGDWTAAAIFVIVTVILSAVVWTVLTRSFLNIATAGEKTGKARYVEKTAREKTVFGALLGKEFARFTASSNYMLNCGLGVLLIPACGIMLLVKGREFCALISGVFASIPDFAAVLLCTVLCMLAAMIDITAPSISLEGKSLWIPQSLPVRPQMVLRAKASMQLILAGLPMLFAAACGAFIIQTSFIVKVLICIMPLTYVFFSALFGLFAGIRMPLLNWTNETAPIKQSGAVTIVLFGSWGICLAIAGVYMLVGYKMGAVLYLILWTAVFTVLSLLLMRWIETRGADLFSDL